MRALHYGTLFIECLRKDFVLESRSGSFLIPSITSTLLLAVIAYLGISSSFLPPPERLRIFPVIIWLVYFSTTTSSAERALRSEFRFSAIEAIRLTKVPLCFTYLSKLVLLSLSSGIAILPPLFLIGSACEVTITASVLLISALIVLGHSAISLLLAPLSIRSELPILLLPLLALPLFVPLFLCGTELFLQIYLEETPQFAQNSWLHLLLLQSLVSPIIGVLFFHNCIE